MNPSNEPERRRPRRGWFQRNYIFAVGLALSVVACSSESTTNVSSAQPNTPPPTQDSPPVPDPAGSGTPIRIVIGDDVVHGELWDNASGRSLIAQLPVTLSFSDHNGKEKAGNLGGQLSMEGMPPGDDPQPRDIGWYDPWGDVVFYYGDVGYFNGIARIGRFTDTMAAITDQTGDFQATIELDA